MREHMKDKESQNVYFPGISYEMAHLGKRW